MLTLNRREVSSLAVQHTAGCLSVARIPLLVEGLTKLPEEIALVFLKL